MNVSFHHARQLHLSGQENLREADLDAVADALGHTQLNTTMRYTRADADTLKKNQNYFNEGLRS